MIEKYFNREKIVNNIFDPSPSYANVWYFDLENIIINCDKNKWEVFFQNSYKNKLSKFFNNEYVFNIKVGMISRPSNEMKGRCLKYNEYVFFVGLIHYLTDEIDNYGLNEDERNKRIDELINKISDTYENRNIYFSELLKEKQRRLKDILDNEFNSQYFDVAMKEYYIYKNVISFSKYIEKYYKLISDFQKGILRIGDFFEQNLDIFKFSEVMDLDKFCLLFAKIILDINLNNKLNDSFRYLCFYKNVVETILKEDEKYNVSVLYINDYYKKTKYNIKNFINDYKKLEEKYEEVRNFKLIDETYNDDNYKDIILMEKIKVLYNQTNWKFLEKYEVINKGTNHDINLRIDILENSGYILKPLMYENNYAFIYANGLVVIEKFYETDLQPAQGYATYIMNIDNFIKLVESNINIREFAKNKESNIKRIFHTSINNWQRNLFDEINGTYMLEDALNFINSLK